MSDMTVGANTQAPQKKKLNPALKGALVGGGITAALDAVSVGIVRHLDKDVFESAIEQVGGKAKYMGRLGIGIAAWAAVGAAINAFRHRNDDIDAVIEQRENKENIENKAQ